MLMHSDSVILTLGGCFLMDVPLPVAATYTPLNSQVIRDSVRLTYSNAYGNRRTKHISMHYYTLVQFPAH